jgi:endonuclease-3 related protein
MARSLLRAIHDRLLGAYGEQGWWPLRGRYDPSHKRRAKTARERFEISAGAILTQSTSWSNAARAIEALREASALSRRGILRLGEEELAEAVRSSGYFRQKARKLRAYASVRGTVDRERLLSVWGMGPETVDSILLYAHDIPVFVVDAYTRRIFTRIGVLSSGASYDAIQEIFERELPPDAPLYNEYHALIVRHAKEHCRKTPDCRGCPIRRQCGHGRGDRSAAGRDHS